MKNILEFRSLCLGQVLFLFQKTIFRVFQHICVIAPLSKTLSCLSPDLVNSLREILNDMKTIQYMESIWRFFPDYFYIRFPHIGTDEFQLCAPFLAEVPKKPEQCLCSAFLSNKQQTPYPFIDLVNECQILVVFPVLNLVNTDGSDPIQFSMFQTIFHN